MKTQDTPLVYGPFISRAQAKAQGLKHYFTGKPCKHGHVSLRHISGKCLACNQQWNETTAAKEYKRQHYLNDKAKNPEKYAGPEHARKRREYMRSRPGYAAKLVRGYRARHPERCRKDVRDRNRRRYQEDPIYRMINNLRRRYSKKIQRNTTSSTHVHQDLLGCTIAECRAHIEALFMPGMTWDNMGFNGWHIDHIRPCASFDLTDPEQQHQCFHYTNLQPLWAADNLAKSDNWDPSVAA